MVFPFNVNAADQGSSSAEKNHWVLGIFDRDLRRFTSFGIDASLSMQWASELQGGVKEIFPDESEIDCKAQAVRPLPYTLPQTNL
jgi:hypothetical protein